MGDIDVLVKADPASCRQAAAYLKRLAQALDEAASSALKASSVSESFWEGEAADTFREQIFRRGRDVDELVRAADRAGSGLDFFADEIDTVRQRMNQCLQTAREAGLTVTGTLIHQPPGDASDTAPQGAGGDMPGLDPNAGAHAEAKRKLDAFREIEATVDEERRRERTAHKSLLKAMDGSNTVVDTVADTQTWIARSLSYAGTAHGTATTLAQNATSELKFASDYARWSADSTLPAAVREAHMERLLANAGMDARAANSNARLLAYGGWTRAGDLVFSRLTPTLGGSKEGQLRSVGKAFSVVGVVAAAWFTGKDILAGKPIGKSIWVNFGGLGASTAVSTGAEAVAAAAGATGGPVTAIGLGAGFAAATAWSYFQDNDLHDLYRDLSGDHIDSPNDNSDEYRKARFGR